MKPTREHVVSAARELFGEQRLQEVMAILDCYGDAPNAREIARVQLAILRLSEGDVEKLWDYTDWALQDYRDVLYSAEYCPKPTHSGLQ